MNHSRLYYCVSLVLMIAASGCMAADTDDEVLCFGAHRNRSHFKLLDDSKMAPYFAPNFVWDIRVFKDQSEFLRMTSAMRRRNPKTILGSYASACLAMPAAKDTYPPAKMPLEQCPPAWLLHDVGGKTFSYPGFEDRKFLDLRKSEVRQAIIHLAISRAQFNGLDAVCFDNCYWQIQPFPSFPVSAKEWTDAYMSFYAEAGKAAKEAKLKCVVNVATTADGIVDALGAIGPHVDGFMSEMAFHPIMRSADRLARELKGYEDALKQGKIILLMPRRKEDEKFALQQIEPLAETYGNIYVTAAGPVHDEPLYHRKKPNKPKGK